MRPLLEIVVSVCLLAVALPGPANGAERSMTLNEAIQLALQKSDALLIERESAAAATSAVKSAKGAYDPLLEVDGGWSRTTEPINTTFVGAPANRLAPEIESAGGGVVIRQLLPTGGALSLRARGDRETNDGIYARLSPAYQTQVGVELRQPLLRDRSIDAERLDVRVAEADREGATASLRRTTTETVAAVEQVYWSLVAARLGERVREEAVQLAEEQLAETQTRVETGAAPETEIAQPRAELERRRGELLAAREAVSRAENTLKLHILGDDDALWASQIAPAESVAVEVTPVDTAASMERALSSRPELVAIQAVVNRRRAETAFARDAVWPSLDAVFSYDRFGLAGTVTPAAAGDPLSARIEGDLGGSFESLADDEYDATRVALVLGLPIRNRTASGNAEIARRVERQAKADQVRIRKAIRAEVLDAAAALETTGQRIEATRSAREAAEIQFAAEKDRYGTGLSTNFLVLTRQNDLSRARLDEISALTDYRMARTDMARATGSLLEERGITVEETKE